MRMVRVRDAVRGNRIQFIPRTRLGDNGQQGRPVTGRVIWVHPKLRFVVMQYEVTGLLGRETVTLRECLPVALRRARA